VTAKQADSVLRHIDGIIGSRLQGTRLDDADSAWLGRLPDKFYGKLLKVGLVEPRTVAPERVPVAVTLGELLTDHARDGRTAKG
jgi:hypothetical protein